MPDRCVRFLLLYHIPCSFSNPVESGTQKTAKRGGRRGFGRFAGGALAPTTGMERCCESYTNLTEETTLQVGKHEPFGSKWRLLAQVEVRNYILISKCIRRNKSCPFPNPVIFGGSPARASAYGTLQTGTNRISGLLQQPQDQGETKGLAACITQTASPSDCLNNYC